MQKQLSCTQTRSNSGTDPIVSADLPSGQKKFGRSFNLKKNSSTYLEK